MDRIALILSGSCTPASDLLAAIEADQITRYEASVRYNERFVPSGRHSLEQGAAYERRVMRELDC